MCQPTRAIANWKSRPRFPTVFPRAFAFRLGCGYSHNQEEGEHHHDHLFQNWYLLDLGFIEPDNGKSVVFCRVGKVSQSAKAEIPHNVVADKMTLNEETGLFSFEGNVQVQSEGMEIYAESLEFNPAQDKGKDPGIQADRFSFDAPGGRIALEGNVKHSQANSRTTFECPAGWG